MLGLKFLFLFLLTTCLPLALKYGGSSWQSFRAFESNACLTFTHVVQAFKVMPDLHAVAVLGLYLDYRDKTGMSVGMYTEEKPRLCPCCVRCVEKKLDSFHPL